MHTDIIVKKDGHREVDLIAAAKALLKKSWLIAFVALLCGALLFAYTYLKVEPEYKASMTLYVSNNADPGQAGYVTTSDISASMMLMYTYAHVLKSEETVSEIAALSETGRSVEALKGMIDVNGVENTNILLVTATSSDPQETVQILDAVAEIAPELPKTIASGSSVKVLSRAALPTRRSSPSYPKAAMVGVIIGGFLSSALVLLSAATNTKIRNAKDLAAVDCPLLGTIPLTEDQAKGRRRRKSGNTGYLLDDEVTYDVMRRWKQIEKNLMFSLPGSGCKKILFTSVSGNVRKCTSAVNLARQIAGNGHRSLLVDCNLLKSEIAVALNLENKPGLSNVLTGQSDVRTALHHVSEKLDVLASGLSSPNPAQLLGSEEMRRLLQETEKEYGFVFLNTAPAEGRDLNTELYRQMSGIVIVIRAGVTKRDMLRDHIETILAEGGTVLGLILSSGKRQ